MNLNVWKILTFHSKNKEFCILRFRASCHFFFNSSKVTKYMSHLICELSAVCKIIYFICMRIPALYLFVSDDISAERSDAAGRRTLITHISITLLTTLLWPNAVIAESLSGEIMNFFCWLFIQLCHRDKKFHFYLY